MEGDLFKMVIQQYVVQLFASCYFDKIPISTECFCKNFIVWLIEYRSQQRARETWNSNRWIIEHGDTGSTNIGGGKDMSEDAEMNHSIVQS